MTFFPESIVGVMLVTIIYVVLAVSIVKSVSFDYERRKFHQFKYGPITKREIWQYRLRMIVAIMPIAQIIYILLSALYTAIKEIIEEWGKTRALLKELFKGK